MATTYGWVTLAEAETYFATRLNSSSWWVSGADKEGALQTAYYDLVSCNLWTFPSTASASMKRAQFEQALFLLVAGESEDRRMAIQAQGVQDAGMVKERYKKDTSIPISQRARALLDTDSTVTKSGYAYLNVTRTRDTDY